MAKLFVVRTGETIWQAQSRVHAAAGAPLTDAGRQAVEDCAGQIAAHSPSEVYFGVGQAERETADLLAEAFGAKRRSVDGLSELDYGLWQGLTVDEIRQRQPTLYRQWLDDPSTIRPPGGESVEEASERLRSAVRDIGRRRKRSPAVVVLPPVMLGLLRCLMQDEPLDALWRNVDDEFTWTVCELDEQTL